VRIDNSWKRGRVTRITEEEEAETCIEVFLVDSGLTEAAVRAEDVVPLPDQFITRLPFQVQRVKRGTAWTQLLGGSGQPLRPAVLWIRIQEGKNEP
jgi:hypothetical protein